MLVDIVFGACVALVAVNLALFILRHQFFSLRACTILASTSFLAGATSAALVLTEEFSRPQLLLLFAACCAILCMLAVVMASAAARPEDPQS